jgi:hypothetical protein
VSGTHLGPATNFSFSFKFSKQLRVCYFVASSLTRGRVYALLLLLVFASAVPRDSRPYFIVPILEASPTWRARSPYFYPPRNTAAQIYRRALGSLSVASYDSQGYGGAILSRLHTRLCIQNKPNAIEYPLLNCCLKYTYLAKEIRSFATLITDFSYKYFIMN